MLGHCAAVSVDALEHCLPFGQSHFVDKLYSDCPKTEGFPNPWHVGTLSREYPNPGELIQAEVEMLSFLFSTVVELKPKLVVETGTNIGLGTRALASGCWVNGFGRVVSSDVNGRMVEFAKNVCRGFPAEIRQCPSLELPELREADLVFIDSSYESRTEEARLVKPGAVYIYHDSGAEPWIRPELAGEQYKVHVDGPRGFSIVRKP